MAKHNSPVLEELHIPELCRLSKKEAIRFSAELVKSSRYRRRMRSLLLTPEMIAIQREAAQELGSKAWKLTQMSFPLYAESIQFVAFLWFFDILVQNGSLRGVKMPTQSQVDYMRARRQREFGVNRVSWSSIVHPNPAHKEVSDILLCWTLDRAKKCIKRWQSDVISRKGTIAAGLGKVHGTYHRNIHQLYTAKLEDLL